MAALSERAFCDAKRLRSQAVGDDPALVAQLEQRLTASSRRAPADARRLETQRREALAQAVASGAHCDEASAATALARLLEEQLEDDETDRRAASREPEQLYRRAVAAREDPRRCSSMKPLELSSPFLL